MPNKIFSEFGRQMLIGPNPMSIHLCTGVGDRWKEAPTLPCHLFNGQTLEVRHPEVWMIFLLRLNQAHFTTTYFAGSDST